MVFSTSVSGLPVVETVVLGVVDIVVGSVVVVVTVVVVVVVVVVVSGIGSVTNKTIRLLSKHALY